MVNILNSVNNYQLSTAGLNQENVQEKLEKSKQVVSDNFESNSAVKAMNGNKDPDALRKTILLLPPLVMGNRLIDKSIGGESSRSLLGKCASLGDKISHILHMDKVVSKSTGSRISNFFNNNRFFKYFTNQYKAVPRTSFAKSQTMVEKYSAEAGSALAKLKNVPELASKYFDETKGFFSSETLKYFGLKDGVAASKEGITKSIVDDLSKGLDKVLKDGVVDVVDAGSALSDPVRLSTISNKLKAANSELGSTGVGKIFAKGALKTKDVVTYGGGLLSLAFTANALIQATKAAKEAPKGEKKSTFMHVLSENYIGILLFQPSINLMYKAGGNKYRGMTVEARQVLKDLVARTNADETITKEALKLAKLQRDLLIKGVDKDKVSEFAGKAANKTAKEVRQLFNSYKADGAKLKFWEKPLKFMGKLLDSGLDTMKKPKYANVPILGRIKVPHPTLKGFAGGFARFAIIMFVIQPFIQKPVTKLCHKIFGEPKTYLAKKEGNNKKADKKNKSVTNTAEQTGETNLVKKWTHLPQSIENSSSSPIQVVSSTNRPAILQAQQSLNNTQPIASQELIPQEAVPAQKINDENKTRYIPKIEAAQEIDNSKEIEQAVNMIMKRSDNTIKRIEKVLS